MPSPCIYVVAAEPSGDLLARETIESLRKKRPGTKFAGIGGNHLAMAGIDSPIDINPLSVLGLFEGLLAWRTVIKLVNSASDDVVACNPDAVVLIDSWGFMLRLAHRIRKRAPHIKLIKLVGPQVWATRPGRARSLARSVDLLICVHRMEVPFYTPYDLPVQVMGNPALGRMQRGDGLAWRQSAGIKPDQPVLLVLPGSRVSEIRAVAPVLVAAAQSVKQQCPQVKIVCMPGEAVHGLFCDQFCDIRQWAMIANEQEGKADVMAAADYALACSGTVTSELAIQGTPFLVGYKTGWVTWFLVRCFLLKPRHVTLLNIAAGDREIVPEYIQSRFRVKTIATEALAMLTDPGARTIQVQKQNAALKQMMEGNDQPPPDRAAAAILAMLDQRLSTGTKSRRAGPV